MKFKIVHSAGKSPYKNISCNNIGQIIKYNNIDIEYISKINIRDAYLIHFRFKSTEEFINKYKRGYRLMSVLINLLEEYFKYNIVTLEKICYLEKELKINLTKYKKNKKAFINIFNKINKKNIFKKK